MNERGRAGAGARLWRVLGWAALVAVLFALAFIFPDYRLYQFQLIAIYAIVILGLNILTGYNGQFSLGHGAFYAAGAYVTATMMLHWQTPYWLTIPCAGLLAGMLGFLFGLPALRLSGIHLALATFALAVSTPQVLKKWTDLTHGSRGILLQKPGTPAGLDLTPDQWLYLLTAAWALVLYVLAWNLLGGRAGRAFRAVRDSEIAAAVSGISLARYKTLAFSLSAFYAGVAGGLSAVVVGSVFPDSFPTTLSVTFVIGMVIGGAGSVAGSLLGAIFIEFLPLWTQQISKAAPGVIYGVALILFMFVVPTGLYGFLRRVGRRLADRLPWRPRMRPASRPTPEVGKEVVAREP
jgi:branched-chain amino acid transport system permease protein